MNNARRSRLRKMAAELEKLRQAVEFEHGEEETAADNLEDIGQADRAAVGFEHAEALDEAVGAIVEAIDSLERAVE